ncbi:MAG: cysteine peptidase family C39 domain-containing protein [Pseudomonadota bacterium]
MKILPKQNQTNRPYQPIPEKTDDNWGSNLSPSGLKFLKGEKRIRSENAGQHKRHFPPGSGNENCALIITEDEIYTDRPYEHFIPDEEIRSVLFHPNQFQYRVDKVTFGKQEDGKHVVQQRAWNSCSIACNAMIALDHGARVDFELVANACNPSLSETVVSGLISAGLDAVSMHFPEDDKVNLAKKTEELLRKFGSCIASVYWENVSSHAIVLDHFSIETDTAVIRDPFHGWTIETGAQAFLKRSVGEFVVVRGILQCTEF